jgi:hypothetical protein
MTTFAHFFPKKPFIQFTLIIFFSHYHCAKKFSKNTLVVCGNFMFFVVWNLHLICCMPKTFIVRFLTYPMYEIFDFLLCDDGNEWPWQRFKMWMYKFMSYFLKFCDPFYTNWLSNLLEFFPIVPQCKNIENLMHLNQH